MAIAPKENDKEQEVSKLTEQARIAAEKGDFKQSAILLRKVLEILSKN